MCRPLICCTYVYDITKYWFSLVLLAIVPYLGNLSYSIVILCYTTAHLFGEFSNNMIVCNSKSKYKSTRKLNVWLV